MMALGRLHNDLDVLVERIQKSKESFDGKAFESPAQQRRNFSLIDSKLLRRLDLFESFPLNDLRNLSSKLSSRHQARSIREKKILENITAAPRDRAHIHITS